MTTRDLPTCNVRSADGTTIAYEQAGTGPVVILVDAAGSYRGFGPMRSLAGQLAADFTVFTYDRRGRGDSTDTLPYAVEREVEDLAALITTAGGSACLYGFSSGAVLALHVAASGLAIRRLALLEPPIAAEDEKLAEATFTNELAALVAEGRRWDAVEFFHHGIGVPPEIVEQMDPASRAAFERIAHTLVYDCMISVATSLDLVAAVPTPTLVIDSEGTTGELHGWVATVVEAMPNASHRSLAGEWHGVSDAILVPVLTGFFKG